MPGGAQWLAASGRRTGFQAEIYEWQIAALLATAQVDAAAKARIVGALGGERPAIDTRRVTRLEQELRAVALDNAYGRMTDEIYIRRRSEPTQIEAARRPESAAHTVDPKRALGYLNDLRSLWDVELPESPEHQDVRHEYERRRAQATAAGFERLEVLGPVIVEAKLSADPIAGASLALSLQPDKAELVGQQADVVRTLLDGHHSRLAHTDTPEARKKRRQRTATGTVRCLVGARGDKPPLGTLMSRVICPWRSRLRGRSGGYPDQLRD